MSDEEEEEQQQLLRGESEEHKSWILPKSPRNSQEHKIRKKMWWRNTHYNGEDYVQEIRITLIYSPNCWVVLTAGFREIVSMK